MDTCGHVHYSVLDDYRRYVNNTYLEDTLLWSYKMNSWLTPGWYRFKLNGTNAVMPTYCVPTRHCSTRYPVWLDMMGGTLPRLGEEKEARSCVTNYDDCCDWSDKVTVRNCGDFFIYRLQPTLFRYSVYCVSM
ncbi:hypothetical protein V1264_016957 [Littorina saxatilis]|uniref:UMOD/GP2/OIT3-like D8C domain-containing protein n=1 Tax=Littorina saxatilis TaxID=31220 RepID=A0AAN9BI50_9CAEN